MPYIHSTHATDVAYTEYDTTQAKKNPNVLPIPKRTVTIKGGAGLQNKRLFTPGSVVTEVSNDDLAFLMQDQHFVRHMADGFIRVEGHKFDADVVGADMNQNDKSRPVTPEKLEAEGAKVGKDGKVVLGGKERDKT